MFSLYSRSKESGLEKTRCKEVCRAMNGKWQPQRVDPGRHLRVKPEAMQVHALDFTGDPTGMCARGGAPEDVFRPQA